MSYSAPAYGLPEPVVLSSLPQDIACGILFGAVSGASAAWSANVAVFVPVKLSQPRTYTKAWWANGIAVAGNVDVGIYTLSGTTLTRVVASTAEAQANVSVVQVASAFSTTTIGPGIYYLALSATSSSSTFWRSNIPNAVMGRGLGLFNTTTSSPLPSTITTGVFGNVLNIPSFGFTEASAANI